MIRGRRRHLAVAAALALALPAASAEAQWQSLEGVQEAVVEFLRETLDAPGEIGDIRVDHLDTRLHLTACEAPLEPFLLRRPTRAGRVTVGVRCTAPKPWKLYVPAQITRYLAVVTAAHPIPRGTPVDTGDLRIKRVEAGALRGAYYRRTEAVLGLQTRYAIGAGEVISPRDVTAPMLVRRGQVLIIEASSATVTISMKGRALEDGGQGELVRVRNLSSDRVVQARVVARDRVQVPL